MTPAQLQALEDSVNEKIRGHVPVNVQLLSVDDPAVEKVRPLFAVTSFLDSLHLLEYVCVFQVRSRGLPDDHAGPIRIIDIEGVDANMCCGTHVSNLSHLQVRPRAIQLMLTCHY